MGARIISLCLLLLALGHPARANGSGSGGGVGHGGGGDEFALSFVSLGNAIVGFFENLELGRAFPEVKVDELRRAVAETRVESREVLLLRGAEVDAINYAADRLIQLSRKRWGEQRESDPSNLYPLVLHEYLGIMGVPDSNYEISSRFKRWLADNGLPLKMGRGKFKIFRYEATKQGGMESVACAGEFDYIASFADEAAYAECEATIDGVKVTLQIAFVALLGDWRGQSATTVRYFSWFSVLHDYTDRKYQAMKSEDEVHSLKLAGNHLLFSNRSNYVRKRMMACSYGPSKNCVVPGEPSTLFYAEVISQD